MTVLFSHLEKITFAIYNNRFEYPVDAMKTFFRNLANYFYNYLFEYKPTVVLQCGLNFNAI